MSQCSAGYYRFFFTGFWTTGLGFIRLDRLGQSRQLDPVTDVLFIFFCFTTSSSFGQQFDKLLERPTSVVKRTTVRWRSLSLGFHWNEIRRRVRLSTPRGGARTGRQHSTRSIVDPIDQYKRIRCQRVGVEANAIADGEKQQQQQQTNKRMETYSNQ